MGMLDRAWAWKQEQPVTSAARAASGNTGPLAGHGPAQSIRAQLNITAVSGTTPTLDVVIEDTLDGTNWNTVATFAQKVAAGREVINVHPAKAESATFQPLFADILRVRWTIGGTTPSFTFTLDWVLQTGEA